MLPEIKSEPTRGSYLPRVRPGGFDCHMEGPPPGAPGHPSGGTRGGRAPPRRPRGSEIEMPSITEKFAYVLASENTLGPTIKPAAHDGALSRRPSQRRPPLRAPSPTIADRG